MTNEIKKIEKKWLLEVSEETVKKYLLAIWANKLSDEQVNLFLNIAVINWLNPFKKQIYAVPYEIKNNWKGTWQYQLSIIIWYEVYLQRAEASGLLDKWRVTTIKDWDKIKWAKIEIWRKDFKDWAFEWEVNFKEFCKMYDWKPQWNWAEKPEFMIKKVAIAQWFRLCFPNIIDSQWYDIQSDNEEYVYSTWEIVSSKKSQIDDIVASVDIEAPKQDEVEVKKYYSELSGEEIKEDVYLRSKKNYDYALAFGEQKKFNKIKEENPDFTKEEVFAIMKEWKTEKAAPKQQDLL